MKIDKVVVTDFRSHKRTIVSFKRGINLIIGQNGSGKSSLLDAIMVGLYWPSRPRDLKKDDFIRVGGERTEIALFIEKDGVEYQIYRDISRGMAFVKYNEDGKWKHVLDSPSHMSVREWAERLLPYDVFMNAVYVRQGEIEAILESDESREKVVRQVLGLDRYENAYRNLLDVRKEIDARIKAYEEFLRDTAGVEDEIREKEERLSAVETSLESLTSKIPLIEAELKEKERELSDLNDKKRSIEETRVEIEKLDGDLKEVRAKVALLEVRIKGSKERIEELRERVRELQEIKGDAEEYEKLRETLERYRREKNELEKVLEGYKASLRSYEERVGALDELESKLREDEERLSDLLAEREELEKVAAEYESVQNILREIDNLRGMMRFSEEEIEKIEEDARKAEGEREEITSEMEGVHSRMGELRNLISERRKAITELKRAKGKCPVCGARLTEEHREKLLKDYEEEIRKAEEEIGILRSKEEELKKKLRDVERRINLGRDAEGEKATLRRIRELELRIKDVDVEELKRKASRFKEVEREVLKLEQDVKHLRRDISERKRIRERIEVLRGKIRDVEKKLEGLRNGLKALGYEDEGEIERRIKELKKVYDRYHELTSAPEELKREEAELKANEDTVLTLKGSAAVLESRLRKKRDELKDLLKTYDKERHEEVLKELMGLRENLASMRKELENLRREESELRGDIRRLTERKKKREERERGIKDLHKARERVQALREKVRRYKTLLREVALAKVGEIASEIFEELTEEKYSGITVKAEERKVILGVLYEGKEYSLGFLSGGERIALALAFRLALSLYLAGEMSLLILDEPTPYLDEERRRRLVDIMGRYLRKIPQVIIVSHDEELKDAADRVIRVSLENGVSVVREVDVA